MGKPVRVVFNADTGQFVSAVDGGTAAVQKQADTVAAAKNKVLEFGRQSIEKAKENGASQRELQRIYEQTLGQITQVSETNAQRVIAGKDRIIEKNRQVAQSQRELAKVFEMPIADHADDITNKQRASAVLRGGGIRAGETFLTQFSAFNTFAKVAFPALGFAAMAKEVWGVGEAIHKVYDEAVKVGPALSEAMEDGHSKAGVLIDDLTVQADKLQDNIDKLHGHPGNGLQTALDEARRYADKLRESLVADRVELQKLFKEHNVGSFGSLLSGVADTGKQHDELLQDHKDVEGRIDRINGDYAAKAAKATGLDQIKQLGKERDKAIEAALREPVDRYAKEHQRLVDEQGDSEARVRRGNSTRSVDNSAKIAGVDLASQHYTDFANKFAAQQRVADLTEQELQAEQDKAKAEAAKRGNGKAQEAARKAAEEQRRQWEADLAALQSAGKLSAQAVLEFWDARVAQTKRGTENYREAVKHANEAQKQVNDEQHKLFEESLKMREQFERAGRHDVLALIKPGSDADGKGKLDAAKTYNELQDARQRSADSLAEATVQYDLQAGRISRHDAALRMERLHTDEYTRALQQLQEELAAVQDGPDAEAQRNRIRTKMVDLDGKHTQQQMQDAAEASATTWEGAMRRASANIGQNFADTARQAQQLFEQALNGVNDNLAEAMTGGKTDWSGMFRGLSKTMAHTALERAEAPILKSLGLGKNDGSDDNPWAVKIVGGSGSSGGVLYGDAGLGGLHKMFGGGDDDDSDSSGGGFFGSLKHLFGRGSDDDDDDGGGGFGGFLSGLAGAVFGGHRALGGPVKAGVTYDVGEMGRERFTAPTDGYITPTNQLGGSQTIHVDARGSSDPAQVEASVHRAMAGYLPALRKDAAGAVKESNARLPPNRRK